MKLAVIKTGGKQYLVQEADEIVVDMLEGKKDEKIELETLALIDEETVKLGDPALKEAVTATIVDHIKGDKIRVAKFKSKVRYRKVRGFRPRLSKLKIGTIK